MIRKAIRTKEERDKIIREYLMCEESAKDVAARHGIKPGTLNVWVKRYHHDKICVSLPKEPLKEEPMARKKPMDPDRENALLRQQVKELQDELRESQLQNLALNTLIDIAEEQGTPIRKKSGAKQ